MNVPEIKRAALVGAGNQGPKIAYRCAVSGLDAALYDISPGAMNGAFEQIGQWLEADGRAKAWTGSHREEIRRRLHWAESLEAGLAGADLVIEAVPEKMEAKRLVLADIERLAPPTALVATNSSSLPSSLFADLFRQPGRLFNINFSNPQQESDRLVELMRGPHTHDRTILAGERFAIALNMVPVVTLKEIMGFSFNRAWRAIKKEVLHLADQGYVSPEDLDRAWMMEFGTGFGPFGLMDIVGLDTIRDIENQYYQASKDERDKPPAMLDEMISQGKLGVKTGQGFYSHPDPDYKKTDWLHKKGRWKSDLAARLNGKEF